jgi:hypothetical protein
MPQHLSFLVTSFIDLYVEPITLIVVLLVDFFLYFVLLYKKVIDILLQ